MTDDPSKKVIAPDSQTRVFSRRWGRFLLALCITQCVVLLVLTGLWNHRTPPPVTFQPKLYSPTNREPYFLGNPGPWGELEFARINIAPPDEFIPVDGRMFEKTKWFFPDFNRAQLLEFFGSCELTETQRWEFSNQQNWIEDTNGIIVVPSTEQVLHLTPDARTKIYSLLSKNPRNDFQAWPYVYRNTGFDAWFENSGLSATTRDWLKRLVYQRGNSLCFSDLPELFTQIPDLAEQRRLLKALSRNSTLLMKLQLRESSDIPALTDYWAKGGRAKDIAPLLESLTKVPGGMTLDIAHLLPPFARKRLNTYISPDANAGKPLPDCYWTAFNFFNDPPDDRFFDDAFWRKELTERYTPVEQPTFGDIIFLLRPDSVPIHAAVYIADDVVFTKNGANYRQPWMLMKLEDLIARYPENYSVGITFFRLKELSK